MREIVVSGIRSTGNLHLGNYYGALRNFVKMQHENDCFFFIADLHSLTTHPDPKMLSVNVKSILAEYLAAGLDPEACSLFIQSDVPEVSELYLLLNMHAYIGELERTASFKDKVRKQPENVNAGLLTYPTLMAADIIMLHLLVHNATQSAELFAKSARVYANFVEAEVAKHHTFVMNISADQLSDYRQQAAADGAE